MKKMKKNSNNNAKLNGVLNTGDISSIGWKTSTIIKIEPEQTKLSEIIKKNNPNKLLILELLLYLEIFSGQVPHKKLIMIEIIKLQQVMKIIS